jgi:hypothetical protein
MWFCQLDGHSHHGPMFWPGGERLRPLSEDLLNIVLKEMKYCCLNTKQISLDSLHKHDWRKDCFVLRTFGAIQFLEAIKRLNIFQQYSS